MKIKKGTKLQSLQWLFAAIEAIVLGIAVFAVPLGLFGVNLSVFITNLLILIGICTIIQAVFGHSLPAYSGPAIPMAVTIITIFDAGISLASILVMTMIAYLIIFILTLSGIFEKISKLFTKLVMGVFLLVLAISIALPLIATIAGSGAIAFLVGIFLIALTPYLLLKGGSAKTIAIPIVVIVGFVLSLVFGIVDLSIISAAPIISLPSPAILPLGPVEFSLDALFILFIAGVITTISVLGSLYAITAAMGRKLKERTIRKSLITNGIIEGVIPPIFGVPPMLPYAESGGIVKLTGTKKVLPAIIAGIVLLAAGFFGKIGAFFAAIPGFVISAVALGIIAMLIGIGIETMRKKRKFGTNEMVVVGLSILIALGLASLPQEALIQAPMALVLLARNPIITATILAIIFERIFS